MILIYQMKDSKDMNVKRPKTLDELLKVSDFITIQRHQKH